MKTKFFIASPAYQKKNNGIGLLHSLCDALNVIGHQAAIAFFGADPDNPGGWRWFATNTPEVYKPGIRYQEHNMANPRQTYSEYVSEGIVIYPDLIVGNPLNAPRVCKYVLAAAHEADFGEDYVLVQEKIFRKESTYHKELFYLSSDPHMTREGTLPFYERKFDATYFGKAPKFSHKIPNTIVLEREWPSDKESYAIFLRNCRFLFTWDNNTATNTDAVRCGCVPIFLHDEMITRAQINSSNVGPYPRISMSNTLDPISVNYNREALMKDIEDFNERCNHFEKTWVVRVADFANDCIAHFKAKEKF